MTIPFYTVGTCPSAESLEGQGLFANSTDSLKNRARMEVLLGVPDTMGRMAGICLGHPAEKDGKASRAPLDQVILTGA